jgi:hypothetical protein
MRTSLSLQKYLHERWSRYSIRIGVGFLNDYFHVLFNSNSNDHLL